MTWRFHFPLGNYDFKQLSSKFYLIWDGYVTNTLLYIGSFRASLRRSTTDRWGSRVRVHAQDMNLDNSLKIMGKRLDD